MASFTAVPSTSRGELATAPLVNPVIIKPLESLQTPLTDPSSIAFGWVLQAVESAQIDSFINDNTRFWGNLLEHLGISGLPDLPKDTSEQFLESRETANQICLIQSHRMKVCSIVSGACWQIGQSGAANRVALLSSLSIEDVHRERLRLTWIDYNT
ncbi:uncharacterized protein LOC130140699 [Syzygium oleosum]|uniref:uncharacterized protein LOC130140699 n=1 Tax=Syzygium oleosum TaxID=219896 RepID=UPI0024B89AFB|nr:uncharacterized protein LOC130140699 [Syzygium oleosum]